MKKYRILFPDGCILDYAVDEMETELCVLDEYPLEEAIAIHIERHGYDADGANVFEYREDYSEPRYELLFTFPQ